MLPLVKDRKFAPVLCLRNRFSVLEHEEPGSLEPETYRKETMDGPASEVYNPANCPNPVSPGYLNHTGKHVNLEPRNKKRVVEHRNLEPGSPEHLGAKSKIDTCF